MNSECTGGFRCISNVCVCPSSMIIREGLCYQSKYFQNNFYTGCIVSTMKSISMANYCFNNKQKFY